MNGQKRHPDQRRYPLGSRGKFPPAYERVVRGLSDADLAEEIKLGKGEAGYREALAAEAARRLAARGGG